MLTATEIMVAATDTDTGIREDILLGRPIAFTRQIEYLIRHPESLFNQWGQSVGIFNYLPGGKGACCIVFLKNQSREGDHWLKEEIQADPDIPDEPGLASWFMEFAAMDLDARRRVLNRFRYYFEKARDAEPAHSTVL